MIICTMKLRHIFLYPCKNGNLDLQELPLICRSYIMDLDIYLIEIKLQKFK